MATQKWSSASAATPVVTDKLMLLTDPSGTPGNGTATLSTLGVATEHITLQVFDQTTAVSTGYVYFYDTACIPAYMAGWNLTGISAICKVASTSGDVDLQIVRIRVAATDIWNGTGMTTSAVTIAATENKDDGTWTINGGGDDVAEHDTFAVNVQSAGTGTTGLAVTLTFQKT